MATIRNITEDTLSIGRPDAPPIYPGDEIEVSDDFFVQRAWPTSIWAVVTPPAVEGYIESPAEDAALWIPADQADEPDAAAGGAFDPAEHTVAAVLAYLEAADVDERTRVIEAEAAGKARTTITAWEG